MSATWIGLSITLLAISYVEIAYSDQRVVFKTFLLSDGATVQCYGSCMKHQDQTKQQFNISQCEGKKVRFGCPIGFNLRIHSATLGLLNPELDVCRPGQEFGCSKIITDQLERHCMQKRQCVYEIDNSVLKYGCRNARYLAFDVNILCEVQTTTKLPSTISSMSSSTTENFSSKYLKSTKETPLSFISSTKSYSTIGFTMFSNDTQAKINNGENNETFWIELCFSLFSISKVLKRNKTHVVVAVVLPIFIGIVLSLCFILYQCRKVRSKNAKRRGRIRDKYLNNSSQFENEIVELHPKRNDKSSFVNRSVMNHKKYFDENLQGNNNNDLLMENVSEEKQVLLPPVQNVVFRTSRPKRFSGILLAASNVLRNSQIASQFCDDSPSALPPPPKEFLENSPTVSMHDFLPPPPPQFYDRIPQPVDVPKLIITSPTASINSINESLASQSKEESDRFISNVATPNPSAEHGEKTSYTSSSSINQRFLSSGVTHKGIENQAQSNELNFHSNDNNNKDFHTTTTHRYENPRHAAHFHCPHRSFDMKSETNSPTAVPLNRKFSLSTTDGHVISPQNVKFALNRRSLSTEEIENILAINCGHQAVPTARFSRHFNTGKENQLFQAERSFNVDIITSNSNSPALRKKSCKGRLHVISSPRLNNSTKIKHERNVITVPKHQCGSGHQHTCICIPRQAATDVYVCTCKYKARCCLPKCDETEKIELERCKSNDFFKQYQDESKSCTFEESGYQSYETGTGSVCSSTRSTDNEDCRLSSLPNSPDSAPKPWLHQCKRRDVYTQEKSIPNTFSSSHPYPSKSSLFEAMNSDAIKVVRFKSKGKRKKSPTKREKTVEFNTTTLRNKLKHTERV